MMQVFLAKNEELNNLEIKIRQNKENQNANFQTLLGDLQEKDQKIRQMVENEENIEKEMKEKENLAKELKLRIDLLN